MAEMQIMSMKDVKATALNDGGNPALMAELYEIFVEQMRDSYGEPVASRDPLRPGYVPVGDAPEPDVRPGDAEDAMVAYLDDPERRSDRRRARRKARRRLAAI